MKSSTDLFDLIKSLSKSEKRYFRLFSSLQQGEKKYMQLFDAVDAQRQYDEAALKEKFAGERFVAQFNVAKKYLYDLIIKSLLVYHAESTVSGEIKEIIRGVEALFERGLLKQAGKLAAKAVSLAEPHEEFGLLAEALRWRQKIEGKLKGNTPERIDLFYRELRNAIDRLGKVVDQERILSQMEFLAAQVAIRETDEEGGRMEELIAQLRALEDEEDQLITSQLISCWTYAFYHYSRNEHLQALTRTGRQLEVLESNPHYLYEHPTLYVRILNNRIMISRCAGRPEEFRAAIESLQRMVPSLLESRRIKSPRVRAELFATIYAQQMGAMIAEGEFEGVIALRRELEAGLEEYEEFMQENVTARLLHFLCHAHFGANDFHAALEYNNRVIDFGNPDLDGGLGVYARIVRLLIYFELEEFDHLEYLLRHTRRYLQRHGCVTEYVCAILELLERLPRLCSPHDIRREFSNAECRLRTLEEDPLQRVGVRYFHFREWLLAKIEGRNFTDVVRGCGAFPRSEQSDSGATPKDASLLSVSLSVPSIQPHPMPGKVR